MWLLLTEQLLTDLPRELEATFGWDAGWSISIPAVAVGIVVITGWEALTAVRRMRDTGRVEPVGARADGQ